jgi:hypothetical protein
MNEVKVYSNMDDDDDSVQRWWILLLMLPNHLVPSNKRRIEHITKQRKDMYQYVGQ